MNSLTLKILLTVYILYALLKFFEFFFRDEETKMKGLYTVYVKGGGAVVKIFDNVDAGLHARSSRFAVLGRGGVREFHYGVACRYDHHSGLLPSLFRALAAGKVARATHHSAQDALLFHSGKSRTGLAGARSDDNPLSLGSLYACNAGIWPFHPSRPVQAVIFSEAQPDSSTRR